MRLNADAIQCKCKQCNSMQTMQTCDANANNAIQCKHANANKCNSMQTDDLN